MLDISEINEFFERMAREWARINPSSSPFWEMTEQYARLSGEEEVLEELYGPGEKPPEKNRPFQNCFEDCPYDRPNWAENAPDWDVIQRHAGAMIAHLDEIEKEIEKIR